jgi:hypothetical protein
VTWVTPGVPDGVEILVITGVGPVGSGGVTVTNIAADVQQPFGPAVTTIVVVPTPTAVTVAGPIEGRAPWAV